MRAWIVERKGLVVVLSIATVIAVIAGVMIAVATTRENDADGGVDITAEPTTPVSSAEADDPGPPPEGWPDAVWDEERWVIPCEESGTGYCPIDVDADEDEPVHEISETDTATDDEIELAEDFLQQWVRFSSDESSGDRFDRIEPFVAGPENFVLEDERAVPEMGWESQARNLSRQGFTAEVEVDGEMRLVGSENNGYWTSVVLMVPVTADYSTQACRRNPNVSPGCNWVEEELPFVVNIVGGEVLWVIEPDFWPDNYYRFSPDQDVHGMPELPVAP